MKMLLLLLVALGARAEEPKFLSLSSDAASYEVGERAALFFEAKYKPAGEEYVFQAKFDGKELNVVPLTDSLAAAISPKLEAGNHSLEGLLHQQKREMAQSFEKTIAYYHVENVNLRVRLRQEVEEGRRQQILQSIAANDARIKAAEDALEKNRKFVQIQQMVVPVTEASIAAIPDSMILQADRTPATYHVGEAATFFVHLNSLFNGPEGKEEPVFSATVLGNPVLAHALGERDFSFSPAPFTASDLGEGAFAVNLQVRPKKRADRLRKALTAAWEKRDEYVHAMEDAPDLFGKRYYELKLEALNAISGAFTGQLNAILKPVDAESLSFSVSE
jgi:hypothetical protein